MFRKFGGLSLFLNISSPLKIWSYGSKTNMTTYIKRVLYLGKHTVKRSLDKHAWDINY